MNSTLIPHDELGDPDLQLLGERVIEVMTRLHIPGVAIGVLRDGVTQAAGFGITSVDNPLPVNAHTLFQVGSISKTFTGTAAMRLVERGLLNLEAPVRSYLPELCLADEETAQRVTLRHLLTHTGGWAGDYFDDAGPGDDALARILPRLARLPQLTPLGTVYSYNNAGFYIAGRLIEAATGKTYEAAVRELVIEPLGLTETFFFPSDILTYRFVAGHQMVEGEPRVARPWGMGRAMNPVGGIISNVIDLLSYARFQMGDGSAPVGGSRLLGAESMQAMQSPQSPASGMTDAVGLTWMLTNAAGRQQPVRIVRHGGSTKGQNAELRMIPSLGFAIAILTNSEEGGQLCEEVAAWAVEHYTGVQLPPAVPILLQPGALAEYAGRYDAPMSLADIRPGEGTLVLHSTSKGGFPTPDAPPPPTPDPPVRLAFFAPDRVVGLDAPLKDDRGEFLRGPDGSITWFRFGGRIHRRLNGDATSG